MILNGHVLFSDADDFVYNEMTVHVPHGCPPKSKESIGYWGGGCGVAQVLTLYPELEQIDIVEPDEMLVEVCREYFPDFCCWLDDPRVTIYYQNGLRFLRNCEDDYDYHQRCDRSVWTYGRALYQGILRQQLWGLERRRNHDLSAWESLL